jgi:hypothetical protein
MKAPKRDYKTKFRGIGSRYPSGLKQLNLLWLDRTLTSEAIQKLGQQIPGFCEFSVLAKTWFARLTFRFPGFKNRPIHILFPGFHYDSRQRMRKLEKSIAVYANDTIPSLVLAQLIEQLCIEYRKTLDNGNPKPV